MRFIEICISMTWFSRKWRIAIFLGASLGSASNLQNEIGRFATDAQGRGQLIRDGSAAVVRKSRSAHIHKTLNSSQVPAVWNQMALLQRATSKSEENSSSVTCKCIGGGLTVGDDCQDGGSPGKCWCYVDEVIPCPSKVESTTEPGRSYAYAACERISEKCVEVGKEPPKKDKLDTAGDSLGTPAPENAAGDKIDDRCGPLCVGEPGCAIPDKNSQDAKNPLKHKDCFSWHEVDVIAKNEFGEGAPDFDQIQKEQYCIEKKGLPCPKQVWPPPTTKAPKGNSSTNSSENVSGIEDLDLSKDNAGFGLTGILAVLALCFIVAKTKEARDKQKQDAAGAPVAGVPPLDPAATVAAPVEPAPAPAPAPAEAPPTAEDAAAAADAAEAAEQATAAV